MGLATGLPQELLANVEANAESVRRWTQTKTLLVDEVSMLSARLFETLDFIGCAINRTRKPFGGIRLVLIGGRAQRCWGEERRGERERE